LIKASHIKTTLLCLEAKRWIGVLGGLKPSGTKTHAKGFWGFDLNIEELQTHE